jgi:hypothetical protein
MLRECWESGEDLARPRKLDSLRQGCSLGALACVGEDVGLLVISSASNSMVLSLAVVSKSFVLFSCACRWLSATFAVRGLPVLDDLDAPALDKISGMVCHCLLNMAALGGSIFVDTAFTRESLMLESLSVAWALSFVGTISPDFTYNITS